MRVPGRRIACPPRGALSVRLEPYYCASALRRPADPHEVSVFLEGVLDLAVKRALYRLANAARQVNVGRVDHQPLRVPLDADDPIEWVLFILRFLLVASQADHFLFVLLGEVAAQRHNSGRELVFYTTTGRAKLLVGTFVLRPPLPAPLMIDRATLRADRAVRQLLPELVRIQEMILLGMPGDAARRS